MSEDIGKELDAVKVILEALIPLPESGRVFVLETVERKLNISIQKSSTNTQSISPDNVTNQQTDQFVDIRTFKDQKSPKSASEMAAVVAYYLQNLAAPNERKEFVTPADMEKYFKLAKFKLPTKMQFTMPNAKAAGYFESTKQGEYKLNAIGYNLVAHTLPRHAK